MVVTPFLLKNGRQRTFNQQTFFFLVLEKTKLKNNVDFLQTKVQSSGGAGFVLNEDGEFKIVGFAYKNKLAAEGVLSNISSDFNPEIIEKTVPAIKRKVQLKISSEPQILEAFKFAKNVIDNFYDNIVLYSKSKISDAEFYRWLGKTALESEGLKASLNNIKNNKKWFKSLSSETLTMLLVIENTFKNLSNEIYKSGKIASTMKNGLVFLIEMRISTAKNVNKIR